MARSRSMSLTFLLNRVLPNFYFPITTIYGILRHDGVEIGKKDYLGKFETPKS